MKGAIPRGALMEMKKKYEKSDRLQRAIDQTFAWTTDNDMLITHSKTNEMTISFTNCQPELTPVTIEEEIDSVQSTKLLYKTLTSRY